MSIELHLFAVISIDKGLNLAFQSTNDFSSQQKNEQPIKLLVKSEGD
jgi:hypothetical protein